MYTGMSTPKAHTMKFRNEDTSLNHVSYKSHESCVESSEVLYPV